LPEEYPSRHQTDDHRRARSRHRGVKKPRPWFLDHANTHAQALLGRPHRGSPHVGLARAPAEFQMAPAADGGLFQLLQVSTPTSTVRMGYPTAAVGTRSAGQGPVLTPCAPSRPGPNPDGVPRFSNRYWCALGRLVLVGVSLSGFL